MGRGQGELGEGEEDSQEELGEDEGELGMGRIRPAILQNPGMDTFRPTEPLCPGKDTLILLWPSKLVKMSFFGKINLQFQAF